MKKDFKPVFMDKMYVKHQKTADCSDVHIGNKKSRWDLLPEVYRTAEEEKVDEVHFCGDIVDGPGLNHKQLIKGELDAAGIDKQRELALSGWSKSKITTKMISGSSHDLEYLELAGHNFTKTFAELATLRGLGKIDYIGEDDIWLRGIREINGIGNLLYHPSGGIPLGMTYRGQNNIEKLVPIMDTAKILKIGHLHVAVFMHYKGMPCILVPCLQEQTQYLVAKGYFPWIGFWVTEVFVNDKEDITRIVLKYFPFKPKLEFSESQKRNSKNKER